MKTTMTKATVALRYLLLVREVCKEILISFRDSRNRHPAGGQGEFATALDGERASLPLDLRPTQLFLDRTTDKRR